MVGTEAQTRQPDTSKLATKVVLHTEGGKTQPHKGTVACSCYAMQSGCVHVRRLHVARASAPLACSSPAERARCEQRKSRVCSLLAEGRRQSSSRLERVVRRGMSVRWTLSTSFHRR